MIIAKNFLESSSIQFEAMQLMCDSLTIGRQKL